MSVEELRTALIAFVKGHSSTNEPGMMKAVSEAVVLLGDIEFVIARRAHVAREEEAAGE